MLIHATFNDSEAFKAFIIRHKFFFSISDRLLQAYLSSVGSLWDVGDGIDDGGSLLSSYTRMMIEKNAMRNAAALSKS